jgi:GGDEF domain-containing protein
VVTGGQSRPERKAATCLSASIGLVPAPVADNPGVDELLARADELMYAEKKASPNSRLAG